MRKSSRDRLLDRRNGLVAFGSWSLFVPRRRAGALDWGAGHGLRLPSNQPAPERSRPEFFDPVGREPEAGLFGIGYISATLAGPSSAFISPISEALGLTRSA